MLHYHQASYDLLGLMPGNTFAPPHLIAEAERRCGRRFPASVSEFYRHPRFPGLFHHFSNDEPPLSLDRLLEQFVSLAEEPAPEEGLLLFVRENQNVVRWYVAADGDDPPVYVEKEYPDGSWSPPWPFLLGWPEEEDPNAVQGDYLLRVADSFSTFVFGWLWHWQTRRFWAPWGSDRGLGLREEYHFVGIPLEAELQSRYQQGPTHADDGGTYFSHYFRPGIWLQVQTQGWPRDTTIGTITLVADGPDGFNDARAELVGIMPREGP
jgi:hypothetical protein